MTRRKNNSTLPKIGERIQEINMDPKDPPVDGYYKPVVKRPALKRPVMIGAVLKQIAEKQQ